jgi:hypothetical protein
VERCYLDIDDLRLAHSAVGNGRWERVSALDRIAILHELDRQADEPGRPSLPADALATRLNLAVPYVEEQLDILIVTERVELERGATGMEAKITPFGRQSLALLSRRAKPPAP